MFNADACYKIIFDALFEERELESIARKVRNYIHASVYFILNSGEVPAYACEDGDDFGRYLRDGYLTPKAYEYLRISPKWKAGEVYRQQDGGMFVVSDMVRDGRQVGSIVLCFSDESQTEDYCQVSQMLRQVVEIYLKDKKLEFCGNISMKRQIYARAVFEGKEEEMELLERELPGDYVMALFSCENAADKRKLVWEIQGICGDCIFSSEEDFLCVVFYRVGEKKEGLIAERIREAGRDVCLSERFRSIGLSRDRHETLVRMRRLGDRNGIDGIMQERDWYMQVVYTYAASMIDEAGLNDYGIQRLLKEDAEKNTELYHTLRMYLLCENSLQETAARLHIHRNTLVYRLKQIRECIGKDINDNKEARELLAFMMMYDVTGKL